MHSPYALAPPDADVSAAEWTRWCLDRLSHHEQFAADPMTNSVWQLALELLFLAEDGRIGTTRLMDIARDLSDRALRARAETFARRHDGPDDIDKMLRSLEGQDFEQVQEILRRPRVGVVFTAHPTFAMSRALQAAFVEMADGRRADASLRHGPEPDITLADEHKIAQTALDNAKQAATEVSRSILIWARDRFPERWHELVPAPLALASWVGYDLDGRTDIHWGQSLRFRLEEKARQLAIYGARLRAIAACSAEQSALADRLEAAGALAAKQAAAFAQDLGQTSHATEAGNLLSQPHPDRLTSLAPILAHMGKMIAEAPSEEARLETCLLRSEMSLYGLGTSTVHVRLNAAQITSALRGENSAQTDNVRDRTLLKKLADQAAAATAKKTNIASIFLQRMTARRQFMLCAQILKHIDEDKAIRFLIAECEAPATVIGALYLARMYGVEHRLDISPLFETPEALDGGGHLLRRLLGIDEYVRYIKARKCLAIQIGFSDSGRYIGQTAAGLAIERLHGQLAQSMSAHGLADVEAVIFNTHGESMGRGGYPGSISERLDYVFTPWARSRFGRKNIPYRAENSYQGGDGYTHFGTVRLAKKTLGALIEWAFEPTEPDRNDDFYRDIDHSWDLFRRIVAWQQKLFDNDDYQRSVGAFAPQLLFATGSRKLRRQSGTYINNGPRALRAIPHNAILQQLGAPANVSGGIGAAAGADPKQFVKRVRKSRRWRQMLLLATEARRMTSLPAIRAYAVLFDAGFWIGKATGAPGSPYASACTEIAERLSDLETSTAIRRLSNHLAADLGRFDAILRRLHGKAVDTERYDHRRTLHALHAIRQTLIMRAFTLVAGLPSISMRHDLSRTNIFALAFAMKFDELADLLEAIFPADAGEIGALVNLSEARDDEDADMRAYPELHRDIIEPLRRIHRDIREIGVGISHYYGAYG